MWFWFCVEVLTEKGRTGFFRFNKVKDLGVIVVYGF